MNIYVDFSNKDLVKKLGCKWNKEENKWQCHHDNSDINIKKLIQHQKDGVLCFITQFISKHNVDKHPESFKNQNLFNPGYKNVSYILYYDEETILSIINNSRQQEKRNRELRKKDPIDDFNDDEDTEKEEAPDNIIEEEKIINKNIELLKEQKQKKYNEMIKKHEEEKLAFKLYYEGEEQHLKNCIYRDYCQDIRSWAN